MVKVSNGMSLHGGSMPGVNHQRVMWLCREACSGFLTATSSRGRHGSGVASHRHLMIAIARSQCPNAAPVAACRRSAASLLGQWPERCLSSHLRWWQSQLVQRTGTLCHYNLTQRRISGSHHAYASRVGVGSTPRIGRFRPSLAVPLDPSRGTRQSIIDEKGDLSCPQSMFAISAVTTNRWGAIDRGCSRARRVAFCEECSQVHIQPILDKAAEAKVERGDIWPIH